MATALRLNSALGLSAALCLALAACENGSPSAPTSPLGCTYTLSVTTLSVPASGGSAIVGVTTTSQCAWIATSDRDWVTITSGASGTGAGTVTVVIGANPGTSSRNGTLTVAGQAVSISEAGQPACSVTLSSSGASFDKGAATGNLTVTSPSSCQWTAVSTASWLIVTSGAAGAGNGTVAYTVEPNPGATARSAAIAVNERSFSVTQEGNTVASCTYAVAPVDFTPCMSVPYDMTATVTTQAACTWTAAPTASWITVTGGQSGSGSGLVSFRVTDNWDWPRYGSIELRWSTGAVGQNLQVAQAGCSYGVSRASMLVAAGGSSEQFQVTQQSMPAQCGGPTQSQCQWTAVSNAPWVTITTPMPQVGDGTVNFVVAPNNTPEYRTTTIVFRDQVVSITQARLVKGP